MFRFSVWNIPCRRAFTQHPIRWLHSGKRDKSTNRSIFPPPRIAPSHCFITEQKTCCLWNIFPKISWTKFVDQKHSKSDRFEDFIIDHAKHYSYLARNKKSSSFLFLFSFVHKPGNHFESNEIPWLCQTASIFEILFQFLSTLSRQCGDTLNNIGPDGGHRNVFSAPPFKRRKWKPV